MGSDGGGSSRRMPSVLARLDGGTAHRWAMQEEEVLVWKGTGHRSGGQVRNRIQDKLSLFDLPSPRDVPQMHVWSSEGRSGLASEVWEVAVETTRSPMIIRRAEGCGLRALGRQGRVYLLLMQPSSRDVKSHDSDSARGSLEQGPCVVSFNAIGIWPPSRCEIQVCWISETSLKQTKTGVPTGTVSSLEAETPFPSW